MTNAGNDPARNNEVVLPTTEISHGTGAVTMDSSMKMNSMTADHQFHQDMPHNDLGDFLQRLTPIATTTLSATDTSTTLITEFLPWYLFLQDTAVAEKTKNFAYIRGTIEVLAVVTAPGNCYGSYVISAIPSGFMNNDNTAYTDPQVSASLLPENCMQVDHFCRVDLAACENVVLQLPFLWPYDYADLSTSGPMTSWTIAVTCLAPIATAIPGGNPLGRIEFFARLLDDSDMVVPRFQGQRKGHIRPTATTKAHAPALHKAASAVRKAEEVADVLSKVPVIGPYAAVASKAAKGISKVASFFGFSRDGDESHPMPIAMRSVTNIAHCDGDDASDSVSLLMGNAISPSPTIACGSDVDVLSTASLFDRYTLIGSFTWSDSDARETTLYSFPVTPSYVNGTAARFVMTTAGWFGMPFEYWRGDMQYLIVLPVSKLHRGAYQVAWVPVGSSVSGPIANITMNEIVDVAAGGDHEFSVGYARDRPVSENIIMRASTIQNYGYTNGRIVIRVVNPLSSQVTPSSVTGFVFAKAGANMEFSVPRTEWMWPGDVEPEWHPMQERIAFQGALGDEDPSVEEEHVLVPSSGAYPMDEILAGERILSVRSLLQRPMSISPFEVNGLRLQPFMGEVPTTNGAFTFTGWYHPAFVGFATSERLKVLTDANVKAMCARYRPHAAIVYTYVPGFWSVTYTGSNQGAEFSLPYYSERKYYGANAQWKLVANSPMRSSILRVGTTTSNVDYYYSWGPDIRCAGFRQVPAMKYLG